MSRKQSTPINTSHKLTGGVMVLFAPKEGIPQPGKLVAYARITEEIQGQLCSNTVGVVIDESGYFHHVPLNKLKLQTPVAVKIAEL